jgi:hypothetical protein
MATSEEEPIHYVDRDEAVAACFGLMRQLRLHLADSDEFLAR